MGVRRLLLALLAGLLLAACDDPGPENPSLNPSSRATDPASPSLPGATSNPATAPETAATPEPDPASPSLPSSTTTDSSGPAGPAEPSSSDWIIAHAINRRLDSLRSGVERCSRLSPASLEEHREMCKGLEEGLAELMEELGLEEETK